MGIMERVAEKEYRLAIRLLCLMTRAQRQVLANNSAGKSSTQLMNEWDAELPAENDSTGWLLQLLLADKADELPWRIKDAVATLLSLYNCGGAAAGPFSSNGLEARTIIAENFPSPTLPYWRALGTRAMMLEDAPAKGEIGFGPDPVFLRNTFDRVTAGSIFAAIGFTGTDYGTGFSGSEELKGRVPADSTSSRKPVSRDVSDQLEQELGDVQRTRVP